MQKKNPVWSQCNSTFHGSRRASWTRPKHDYKDE